MNDSPPAQQASPQLEYAPRPPIHRRRVFRRVLMLVVAAALFLPTAWAVRRGRDRIAVLYWQRRCANFSLPAGSVAYDENPATVATFWASVGSSGNYTQIIDSRLGKPIVVLMRPRGQWETSIRQPLGGLNQIGALFLHARRAASGKPQRIICVRPSEAIIFRRTLPQLYDATSPDLSIEVHDYATLTSDSNRLSRQSVNVARLAGEPFGTVRFFAGQIDPSDESHFTIDFQTATGSGTIDGWLRVGDAVTLTLRPAPASSPAR